MNSHEITQLIMFIVRPLLALGFIALYSYAVVKTQFWFFKLLAIVSLWWLVGTTFEIFCILRRKEFIDYFGPYRFVSIYDGYLLLNLFNSVLNIVGIFFFVKWALKSITPTRTQI